MRDPREKKRGMSSARRHIGFYLSLAFCLMAVLGAAIGTAGQSSAPAPAPEVTPPAASEASKEAPAGKEVSGEAYQPSRTRSDEKEKAAAKESAPQTSQPEAARVAMPIEKGEILRPYSPKDPLYSKTMKDWRTHGGVDISAEEGTSVRSAGDGKVKKLCCDPLLGNMIIVEQTNGFEVSYCGVTDTSIAQEGNFVQAGETLGYVGKIPGEALEGPHLHLEVRQDGARVDPSLLLSSAGK